jgi:hypothetical protein
MKHMEVLDRAERLDELSRYGAERLAEQGISADEIPALVKQVLSKPKATGERRRSWSRSTMSRG